MFGLPLELITMLFSTVLGGVMSIWGQSMKARQMQNDQFGEATQKNEELEEVLSRLEEELSQALKLREDSEERLSEVVELMNRMEEELAGHRQGQNAKDQVE